MAEIELGRKYDTWGNYGQHDASTDYLYLEGAWVKCDQAPGAVVDDRSAHSRKNQHTDVRVTIDVPAGTLGKTWTSEASSSRSSQGREYWRVAEDGSKEGLSHRRSVENKGRVAETWDTLQDGTRLLVSRAPLGVRANEYPGACGCGKRVAAGCGELYKDRAGKWATRCLDCFQAKAATA